MKSFSRHIFTVILFALTFFTLTVCASAASESEPNDDINSANSINVNETVYAHIDNKDNDYFEFTLLNDGYISITVNHAYYKSSNSTKLELSGESGKIIDFTVDGDVETTKSVDVGLPSGTYYIYFRRIGSKVDLDYNFIVNFESSNYWEKEANNDLSVANEIKTNATYYGSLINNKDHDFYHFSTEQNGCVYITVNHEYYERSNAWSMIKLFTYDGSKKTEIFRDFSDMNSETTNMLKFGLPKGEYYIEFDPTTTDYIHSYNFKVNYTATDDWEVYPNNQLTSSTAIQVGKTYYGSFYQGSEKDYYSFNLDKTATIKATFNHAFSESESSFANIKISSYNGTVLTHLANFESKRNSQTTESTPVTLNPGKYYVIVEEYYAEDNEYNFRIDYAAAVTKPVEKPANANTTKPAVNNGSTTPSENITSVDNTYLKETIPFENNINAEENNKNEHTRNDGRNNDSNDKNTVEIPVSVLIAIIIVIILAGAGVAIFFVIKKQKENQNA